MNKIILFIFTIILLTGSFLFSNNRTLGIVEIRAKTDLKWKESLTVFGECFLNDKDQVRQETTTTYLCEAKSGANDDCTLGETKVISGEVNHCNITKSYCHATSAENNPYQYLRNTAWIQHIRNNGSPQEGHELDFLTWEGDIECVGFTEVCTDPKALNYVEALEIWEKENNELCTFSNDDTCPTSYSCDACLVYPYPNDDCYSSMYDYCVGTYNCRWEPSNGVLREMTVSDSDCIPNGEWVCDCPTETMTPTPTDEPSRGGNGDPGAPVCNDAVPPTPSIISAVKLDFDTAKITWTKVTPANDYAILYGQKSGDYPYAVFSTGNTDNFDINGVTDGCFVIKAINGCMPGGLSSEVCTGTGGQVLGASTLGSTGGFAYDLNTAGFALGFILAGFGIRKASSKKVQ